MFVSTLDGARRGRLSPIAAALLAVALPAAPVAGQVTGEVVVEVRSAGDDAPIGNVEITVVGAPVAPVWTGADGRAVLRAVPPGDHQIRVRHLGHTPARLPVEVSNGLTSQLLFRLHPRALVLEGLDVTVEGLPEGAQALVASTLGPETRTVVDAVESIPGITVVRRGGPGSAAVPQIRGSSGDQVLVLVDGVAVNSPLTGEADLSELDLTNVERIVVVPGARAGRYGPRALAGAILIETRSPRATTGQLSVEAGSFGTGVVGGTGALTLPDDDLTLSVGGEWNRSTGDFRYPVPAVRGGGVTTRLNADFRSLSGYLQGLWEGPEGPTLRVRLHSRDAQRGSPGTIVQPSATGVNEQERLGALLQVEDGNARRGWTASLGVDRHDALFADPDPPFGQAYRTETRVRQLEGRGEWHAVVRTVEVGFGADGRWRGLEANTLVEGAPDEIAGGGGWLRGAWRTALPASAALDVSATLRGDVHDLLDGLVASPSVTLLAHRGSTTLEFVVGNSISPPDVSDLFFEEGVLVEANPALAPERVRGEVSVELRQTFAGNGWDAGVGLTAYRADVEGMILWFPDFRFVWSPDNIDVRRRGLEASFDVRAGPLTSLRGDLGLTRVEYAAAVLDGQVVYRPDLTADLAARVDAGGLQWSTRWRYVGARRTSPGTTLNELPGYARLDVALRKEVRWGGVRGSVDLAIDNLLDEPAALLVDYPLPGRALSLRLRAGVAGT